MSRIARTVRAATLGLLAFASITPAPAATPIPAPIARAACGPGSSPEPLGQAQGRVTAADLAGGAGFRCNLEILGHTGTLAGFRTQRYVDPAGHECAYYDSTPFLQPRPYPSYLDPDTTGTHVLDMSDPADPVKTAELRTPAMRSPHESLNVHAGRGLLAADAGNLVTAPGFVDIYDLKTDCRHPKLLSSLPTGLLGHEGTFSPDGETFWVSAPYGGYSLKVTNGAWPFP